MNRELSHLKPFKAAWTPIGDHNIALMSALAASMAQGESVLERFPRYRECLALLEILRGFGIECEFAADAGRAVINGKGRDGWSAAAGEVNVGDSETLLKLLSGAVAGRPFKTILNANALLSLVPMQEIIEPLRRMNAKLETDDEHLPFVFLASMLQAGDFDLPIMDSNTKACLLLAGLFAQGTSRVVETLASSDHPERALMAFGAGIKTDKGRSDSPRKDEDELERRIRMAKAKQEKKAGETGPSPLYRVDVEGGSQLQACNLKIPGDITLSANMAVLACLCRKAELTIEGVSLNSTRSSVFGFLRRMGGDIEMVNRRTEGEEPQGDVVIKSAKLQGRKFNSEEMVNCVDEVPAIAVAAAFSEGQTVIRNIERLRSIDADCITAVTENLRRMGTRVGELPDGLIIEGEAGHKATEFDSYGDSRVGMAFSIAALLCQGKSSIMNVDCVDADFPDFFPALERLMIPQSTSIAAVGE